MIIAIFYALLCGNFAVVGAGAMAALSNLKPQAPQIGYRAWRAALFLPLAIAISTFTASSVKHQVLQTFNSSSNSLAQPATMTTARHSAAAPALSDALKRFPIDDVVLVVVVAWVAGVAVSLVRVGNSMRMMRALVRGCWDAPEGVQQTVNYLTNADIRIYVSGEVRSPLVAGYIKPRIIIPNGLENVLAAAAFRQVIVHELTHVAGNDNFWILCESIVGALLWFNPITRAIRREIAFYRELRCDEAACRSGGSRWLYMRALLEVSQLVSFAAHPGQMAPGAVLSETLLARRIDEIARNASPAPTNVSLTALVTAIGVMFGLVSALNAPALATSRLDVMQYFVGRWTCYSASFPLRAIGTASFSAVSTGLLEVNRSLGGTWTYESRTNWLPTKGYVQITGRDSLGRTYGGRLSNSERYLSPPDDIEFEAPSNKLQLRFNTMSQFESVTSVRRSRGWNIVEDAVCRRAPAGAPRGIEFL